MSDFAPRFTINNRIMAALTTIERARGFLDAATLSDEWVRRMSQRALLAEAYATTHIEGTTLTLAEAELVWAGETPEAAHADDVRELLNYREAFNLVSEYLGGGGAITEVLIRDIHRRLVEGVRGDEGQPGQYRTVQNCIISTKTGAVVYMPPPPADVPALMQELMVWLGADSAVHPVLLAGIAQFQLVHIHPFVDGNGRSSRLLSTLCLYRTGYDFKRLFTLSEYYDRVRPQFYRAIQGVREQGMDLTGWLEFFVEGLATQLGEVKARGELAIRRDVIVREHGLNPRQAEAVALLLEQPEMALEDLEKRVPGVNQRTLQRDLSGLVEQRVLKRSGAARAVRYRLGIKGL